MGPMPDLLPVLLLHLPELACGLGGLGLLAARAPLARSPGVGVAVCASLGLAAVGIVARAPAIGSPLGPAALGFLGLPLLVWTALACGAFLARRDRGPAPGAQLAWLLCAGAPLLRLATWPGGERASLALGALGLALGGLAWSARRGGLHASVYGAGLVALGAGLAGWFQAAAWSGRLPLAGLAWGGALLACCASGLGLRARSARGALLGASGAQLGLLTLAAALSAQHPAFGALGGAAWAWLLPLLPLWALVCGLEESRGPELGRLATNRAQRAAAWISAAALWGAPLTPGFAARLGFAEAGFRIAPGEEGRLAWAVSLGGLSLALLGALGLKSLLRFGARRGAEVREPWVFDSRAALLAAALPYLLLGAELWRPGFACGGPL